MALLPYIPETITVHLGAPTAAAENVSLSFPDYIKNVASSEIYPTWPDSALRANIYCQISFALNRVYTEYYPSRGYLFDITNDTSIDQAFVNGRNIFGSVNRIVDEIFNQYIVRRGYVEPLFAQYCNGTTTTCRGLSQWGSVSLAEQGYSAIEILNAYYGSDIEIVRNAPVQGIVGTAPIRGLRIGSTGNQVYFVQLRLNRISVNYPSIPKIPDPIGYYNLATDQAVREFQRLFYLTQDGIVGRETWYRIQYVYAGVKKLSDLDSEGLTFEDVQNQFPTDLREGDRGEPVRIIQYMLAWVGRYEAVVPEIAVDGIFGPLTRGAIEAFQRQYGLPPSGIMDEQTYSRLFDVYAGLVASLPDDWFRGSARPFPGFILSEGIADRSVETLQVYLNEVSRVLTGIPPLTEDGIFGPETREAVEAFQRAVGLPVNGRVNFQTWERLAEVVESIEAGNTLMAGQFPGVNLEERQEETV